MTDDSTANPEDIVVLVADRAARSARRDRIGWRGFDAATAVAALETEVAVMAAPVVGGPDEPAWGEVGARSTAPLPSTDGWTRICFGADPGGQEEVPGEPDPLASSAEAAGCPVEKGADDAPGGLVTVRRQSPDRPAETGLRPALTEGTAGHSVEKSADPSPGGLATTRPGSPDGPGRSRFRSLAAQGTAAPGSAFPAPVAAVPEAIVLPGAAGAESPDRAGPPEPAPAPKGVSAMNGANRTAQTMLAAQQGPGGNPPAPVRFRRLPAEARPGEGGVQTSLLDTGEPLLGRPVAAPRPIDSLQADAAASFGLAASRTVAQAATLAVASQDFARPDPAPALATLAARPARWEAPPRERHFPSPAATPEAPARSSVLDRPEAPAQSVDVLAGIARALADECALRGIE